MKLSLALATTFAVSANAIQPAPPGTEILYNDNGDHGRCWDDSGFFDWGNKGGINSPTACDALCKQHPSAGLLGFGWSESFNHCVCRYDDGTLPVDPPACGNFDGCSHAGTGQGPLEYIDTSVDWYVCYRYLQENEGTGDPHCKYYTHTSDPSEATTIHPKRDMTLTHSFSHKQLQSAPGITNTSSSMGSAISS